VLLIRVVDLFTFSHSGNQNRQGGHVKLMWVAASSSAILVLWCGCMGLWRNPFGLNKKNKQTKKGKNS